MVQRVAAASRLALATSGRVSIGYKTTQHGAVTAAGTDVVTFSGKNWNDAIRQSFPASKGMPASTQTAINRVVNGQLYLYIAGRSNHLEWVHDTNQAGHPSVTAPDPRTLLRVLTPAAHFTSLGWHKIGGLRLEGLRATDLRHLPRLDSLFSTQPAGRVKSLTVWVDSRSVVRRISAVAQDTVTQSWRISPHGRKSTLKRLELAKQQLVKTHSMAGYRRAIAALERSGRLAVRTVPEVTSVSAVFSRIGQPQHIGVPPHPVSQYSRG
jgi:hypothetical protein